MNMTCHKDADLLSAGLVGDLEVGPFDYSKATLISPVKI